MSSTTVSAHDDSCADAPRASSAGQERRMGSAGQGPKEGGCQAVSLLCRALLTCHSGAFKSGVLPLDTKGSSGKTKAMTLADDLPPINDIEAIFDHLTSRVSPSA